MKKELPNVFKVKLNKNINNNQKYIKSIQEEKLNVYDYFKVGEVYRTKVSIVFENDSMDTTIIGRTKNNLITINNEIIPINSIKSINLL